VTAAAIVTTPQDVATIDARKAYRMFEKTGVACAGVIENMSVFICPHCGQVEHIFGEGGAKKMCADYGIPLLGQLPLSRAVREEADAGKPTVIAEPDSETAKIYRSIARNIGRAIAKLPMDFSSKFPEIVVEQVKKG
jgi:ATP-binding protein involved in chromosome partitioning